MHVQSFPCHLQRGDRLGAIDSGEVDQELIKGISCFQIVEEVLHRDARGSEYGHSALDPGIPVYDWFFHSFPRSFAMASPTYHTTPRERDSLTFFVGRWTHVRCRDTLWSGMPWRTQT